MSDTTFAGTAKSSFFRRFFSRPAEEEAASHPLAIDPGVRRKKILIVDDDPIIHKTVSAKLESGGYTALHAVDASEAIGVVRDETPDLVLLDLSFPADVASGGRISWDGFQIMSWLRGMNEAASIPFVIISGTDPEQVEQRSLRSGAIAFFHKPIDHIGLLNVIANATPDRPCGTAILK